MYNQLILASQSPRRRELIKKIDEKAVCVSSNADENIERSILSPAEFARELANIKAKAYLYENKDQIPDESVIVGCDTIVTLGDKIYGKPKDREEAFRMLKELSGQTHSVITGIGLYKTRSESKAPQFKSFSVKTDVTFNPLTDEQINSYIDTGDPFDKAGSYGIQNLPEGFIKEVQGDYYNVVGLPVEALKEALELF